jgi:hypothetical protein
MHLSAKINVRNNSQNPLFTRSEQSGGGKKAQPEEEFRRLREMFEDGLERTVMKAILRTLVLTGMVAAAGAAAQAQVAFAVGIGRPAPVAVPVVGYGGYIPPCPGDGFVWTPGYYAGSVWVPGRWIHHDRYFVAHRDYRFDHGYRGWDHGRR